MPGSFIVRIAAEQVLVADGVLSDRRCRARADALLARIDAGRTTFVTDAQAEAALLGLGPRRELPRGGLAGSGRKKSLVVLSRLGDGDPFPGYSWAELRDAGRERRQHGVRCQTGIEIQSAVGCAYDCSYCPYGGFLAARLDVERFVDRVTSLVRERPGQTLFKLNNRTDTLGLEPELGLARAMVERFGELGGPHLLLYAKGDAVDSLLDADHRGRTVASFTITPAEIASRIEPGAPPPEARIAALGRMAAAGYPVRVRLSPIVPVRGWQQAYRDLLAQIAAAARPEMITMWTLSMVPFDELGAIVPLDALDPDAVAAARAARGQMHGQKGAPFPPGLRAEMYRTIAASARELLAGAHLALCLETPGVWQEVASLPGSRGRGAFHCNCGPRSTPAALVKIRR